mgnify:FL=1
MAGLYKKEYSLVNKYMPKPPLLIAALSFPEKNSRGDHESFPCCFAFLLVKNRHGTI